MSSVSVPRSRVGILNKCIHVSMCAREQDMLIPCAVPHQVRRHERMTTLNTLGSPPRGAALRDEPSTRDEAHGAGPAAEMPTMPTHSRLACTLRAEATRLLGH